MKEGTKMDYDESRTEEIRTANINYLNGFEDHLKNKGLSAKTIRTHIDNVDFFINYFLLNYEVRDVTHGCYSIGEFLGYFFIKKAMWSSVNAIKSNITSLKKFYSYLLEKDIISDDDYHFMCDIIDEDKNTWFARMERYENIDEDNYDWY